MDLIFYNLLIFIAIVIIFLITKHFCGSWLRHNSIFSIIWLSIIFFSINFDNGLIKPTFDVYALILIFIAIFNVIYLLFYNRNKRDIFEKYDYEILDKRILILNIISYILIVPSLFQALKLLASNGFNLELVRNVVYVGLTNSGSIQSMIFRAIPTAIFSFTSLISSYYLVKKERNKLVLIGIFDVIIGTIIFGGRNFLLNFVIFYFANYINLRTFNKIKINKKYIFIGIIALFFVTSSRTGGDLPFLQSISDYYVGSLSFLQYIIYNPVLYGLDVSHFGYLTLGILTEPIALMLKVLGIDLHVPSYYFNITAQKFVDIGSTRLLLYNNNATIIYPFLLDFGNYFYIGYVIFSAIIIYFENLKNRGSLRGYIFNIFLYTAVINSSINYKLIGLSSTLFFIFVVFCIQKKRKVNNCEG